MSTAKTPRAATSEPAGVLHAGRSGLAGPPGTPSGLTLVFVFTATTFLSALLLFSIQPLFAKMVLPLLGGAPSVWAVALFFFQGALLAGYLYAHALNRYAPPRYVGLIHIGLFALALVALPIALPAGWREPPPGDPYMWQLGLFATAVGLPFMAVAANAPLLQAWFARTGHPDGRDPYFLYGASNLGSFIALLAYPLVFEPAFGLTALSRQWTIGFVLLGFAIAVCFLLLRATHEPGAAEADLTPQAEQPSAPTWLQRAGWVGLALVPSALLTAFTTHIATDVASAPLIWVLPLSLYLLTFVLIFRDKPIVFVPCALAAAAVGYWLATWMATAATRADPAGVAGTVGVLALGGWAGWAYARGKIATLLQLFGQRFGMSREQSWPILIAAFALAILAFYILIKVLFNLAGRPFADDVTEISAGSLRSIGILGALAATAMFTWLYRNVSISPVRWLLVFHLAAVVLALLQMSQTRHDNLFISATIGFAAFFLSGLVAHRTLYEARPAARYLTEFYLWMSFGGVLGGLFAALAAPRLFSEVLEYPILLALTMACRPGAIDFRLRDYDEWLRLWLIAAGGILAVWWTKIFDIENRLYGWAGSISESITFLDVGDGIASFLRTAYHYGMAALLALIFGLMVIWLYRFPVRQFIAVMLMCLAVIMLPSSVKRGEAERSFFGIYRISESYDKQHQILTHGTTLHGAQRIRDTTGALVTDTTPGTYYHPKSPMAQTVDLVRQQVVARGGNGHYGVIGLGTGSLACYGKEGESWRFFEIDPVIVSIAKNPEKFSFVSNCQPNFDVVLGDARLTLAKQPDASFDLIIVDAFSSDAIPVHLMTAEAIRLYASKLKPDGVVLLHISNRYLDLDSVLAATNPLIAGLDGIILTDNDADGSYGSTTSTAGVFSKSKESLEPFRKLDMATELGETTMRGWTDDYSDILGPFLSKYRKR